MQSGVSSQWSLMHPSYYFQQHSSVRFFVSVKFDKNEKHFVFLDESKLFSPSFFLFSSLFFPALHYGQPCCTVCGGCKPLSPTPPYHSTFTCVPFKIVVLICKPNESEDCWTGRMSKCFTRCGVPRAHYHIVSLSIMVNRFIDSYWPHLWV